MSGIAAVLNFADPAELQPVLRMLERRGPDGTDCVVCGPAILGCARLDTLPEDGPQPARCGHVTLVADARLDNRPELERALGMPASVSDTALVAAAVARWGNRVGERLEGDFAVLAWDGARLLALRDRFGVRPLFYLELDGTFILASEIRAILAHPRVRAQLDRDYFIEQLAVRMPLTRLSPYEGIARVMPGEMLVTRPGRPLERRSYYRLPTTVVARTLPEAAEETRGLLERAVRVRLRAKGTVACDLSGGMDSTSIYATARALGHTPHALSVVSDRWPSMDERPFSRLIVGAEDPWTQILAEHHTPFGNTCQAARCFDEPMQDVLFDIRRALNDVRPPDYRVLLSGHGGDSTMTGSSGALRVLLRQGRLLSAYREARAWADRHDLKLGEVVLGALQPGYSPPAGLPWASRQVARRARASAWRAARAVADQAGASVDAVNFLLSTEPGLRQQPIGPVDMRFPFLDRALVEYALTTPPGLKMSAGMGKRVLREAMRGRLPEAVLARSSKTDFTAAYAAGIYEHWPLVSRWLKEPLLAELGVLDAQGFRGLARDFRDGKTASFGEAVYTLVYEAWLRVGQDVKPASLPMTFPPALVRRTTDFRREVERR